MKTSIFPDDWKKAKVTPIFKAGDRSEVGNYRPISILPIVSKIMERAVHDQLYVYGSFHRVGSFMCDMVGEISKCVYFNKTSILSMPTHISLRIL